MPDNQVADRATFEAAAAKVAATAPAGLSQQEFYDRVDAELGHPTWNKTPLGGIGRGLVETVGNAANPMNLWNVGNAFLTNPLKAAKEGIWDPMKAQGEQFWDARTPLQATPHLLGTIPLIGPQIAPPLSDIVERRDPWHGVGQLLGQGLLARFLAKPRRSGAAEGALSEADQAALRTKGISPAAAARSTYRSQAKTAPSVLDEGSRMVAPTRSTRVPVSMRGHLVTSPSIDVPLGSEPSLTGGPPMTVEEMRRMYGSEEAGNRLGMTSEDVKRIAPGPSRIPQSLEQGRGWQRGSTGPSIEGMDQTYQRMLADPRGYGTLSFLGYLPRYFAARLLFQAMRNPQAGGALGSRIGSGLGTMTRGSILSHLMNPDEQNQLLNLQNQP